MGESVEKRVKDLIRERLEAIPEVASLSTTGREKILGEASIPEGRASVVLGFPYSTHSSGCGYAIVRFPVVIEATFRFEQDLDEIDADAVRLKLDDFEQAVEEAMGEDSTWQGQAFDTRWSGQRHKMSSEAFSLPDAATTLLFEVEIHHSPDDPSQVF